MLFDILMSLKVEEMSENIGKNPKYSRYVHIF